MHRTSNLSNRQNRSTRGQNSALQQIGPRPAFQTPVEPRKTRLVAPFFAAWAAFVLCQPASAQTLKVLHSFNCSTDGCRAVKPLLLDGDTLYGTASSGTVFRIKTDGTVFTVLHSVGNYTYPNELILSGQTLYGTVRHSGSNGYGSIFRMDTSGSNYTVLRNFDIPDGTAPWGGVVIGGNSLYGTASGDGSLGGGTVFKINTNGSGFTVLHNFGSSTNLTEPSLPLAGLTIVGDTLYGTTEFGGAGQWGTVFRIGTDGSGFTLLHEFNGGDGAEPDAPLLVCGEVIYGTTRLNQAVFRMNTNGSGFVVLQSGLGDSSYSLGGLVLKGNTLFGTSPGAGRIYKLNTDGGGYATLHIFYLDSEGTYPWAGLVASGNRFYGVNNVQGEFMGGTLFEFDYPNTPVISQIIHTNGSVSITWPSTLDASYRVQYASQPAGAIWTDLSATITGTGSNLSFTDTTPADTQRFYRVALRLP